MKVVILNDTHCGIRNSSEVFLENANRFYSEILFPFIDENKIKRIVHLGDYYDHRKFINFKALHSNRKHFLNPLRERELRMDMILGNHDVFYKNTNDLNSPKELLGHFDDVIKIHTEPTTIPIGGMKFGLVPWITADNKDRCLTYLKKCAADVVGGHFEFTGFEVIKGIENDHGMDPSIVDRFEMVVSGHYHTKSSKGNIHYLGSQMEFYWNDAGDNKYFHVLDTNTRSLEPIRNPLTLFEKIYYDDTKNDYVNMPLDFVDGKFLKVVVINKTDSYVFDRFIDRLADRPIHDLKIVENFNEWIGDNVDDDSVSLEDTTTILNSYIDAVDTDLDKDRIKNQMHTLMIEAQSMEFV